jgi:hypothetical protein
MQSGAAEASAIRRAEYQRQRPITRGSSGLTRVAIFDGDQHSSQERPPTAILGLDRFGMADPLLNRVIVGYVRPVHCTAQAELGIPHGRSIRDASWRLTLDLG